MNALPIFYWNGIKDAKGAKLHRVFYSKGPYTAASGLPAETITIYSREYSHFSSLIHDLFKVENDSDIMTDYFEKDRIRVRPDHPLFRVVAEAKTKAEAHFAKRMQKRSQVAA